MLITLETAYSAVILLVMLWALALVTRRVRIMQTQLDGMRRELRVMNEALLIVNQGMVGRAQAEARAAGRDGAPSSAEATTAPPQRPESIALSAADSDIADEG